MANPRKPGDQGGFTLLEAIVAIVITGVLAGVVATFIAGPVQGYVASVRRAELTDAANASLRRMARDIRSAVPNSVRVDAAGRFVEFLPTSGGGRYAATAGNTLNFATPGAAGLTASASFDILGPALTFSAGDQVVVFNLGIPGADAYEGNSTAEHVRISIASAQTGATTVAIAPANRHLLPFDSPSKRFYVVSAAEQAVSYGCENVGLAAGNGTGTLRRYWAYGINPAQAAPPGGQSALLANNVSACNIVYTPGSVTQRDATVSIVLQLTRADETVSLYNEVHVSNVP